MESEVARAVEVTLGLIDPVHGLAQVAHHIQRKEFAAHAVAVGRAVCTGGKRQTYRHQCNAGHTRMAQLSRFGTAPTHEQIHAQRQRRQIQHQHCGYGLP